MVNAHTNKRPSSPRFKRLPKGPHGGIQLLLVQSVDHLGKQGDVVEVKPGYALNYLIPQGLATLATEHHRRMVEKHRARLLEIEGSASGRACRVHGRRIGRQSITIEANANDEGHLYGSVGAAESSAGLKQAGLTVTSDQVRLEGALKELGLYTGENPIAPAGHHGSQGLGRAHRERRRRQMRPLDKGQGGPPDDQPTAARRPAPRDRSAMSSDADRSRSSRQPPHDLDAEMGVLGSMLLKPDVCDDIAALIRPEDFHDPAHQLLFTHLQNMHSSGKRIDITLLVNALKKAGDFEKVGGAAFLARSARPFPTPPTRPSTRKSSAKKPSIAP